MPINSNETIRRESIEEIDSRRFTKNWIFSDGILSTTVILT